MQTEKLLTDSGDGNDVGVVKTKSSDVASAQAALIHNYTFGFTSVAGNTNPINVDKFIRVDGTETDTTMFGERLITADEVNSKFPANVNEIVISDYTANELIAEGHNGVTTLKEVVGTKLGNFTISGIYQTLTWIVSVMLPPMAIFFPLFTILEDLGYLPRIAFNMDGFFKKCCCTR